MECVICSAPVAEGRWELGYEYCTDKTCVAKALSGRRAGFRLVLMPKQGFTYVPAESDDLKRGRSSGR